MEHAPVRFRILGPLEVHGPSGLLVVRRPLHRLALTTLLLDHDAPCSATDLAIALWGDDLPAGWRDSLRTCIYGLRSSLGDARGRLVTIPGGWLIRLLPGELDLDEFRSLSARGRAALDARDLAGAIEVLGRAAGLWRRPALADVPDGARQPILGLYRAIRADMAQARLEAGHSHEMLGGLRQLVSEDPGDERTWAQLMTALARCGQRAEALTCYQQARAELRQSYGIEPGPQLRDLHSRILGDELLPGALPGDDWLRACQLPAVPADFTGRAAELDQLAGSQSITGVSVRVILGAPGIGKTTLAARAAWLAASGFPGGQLFVRIGRDQAGQPAEILAGVMRSLGVPPARIPPTSWEREAMYRSVLGGRPTLIVADDATSPEQVQALLPGAPGSAMIVTATEPLTGIDGARYVSLAGLAASDSVKLLTRIVGAARVCAEPAAAEAICAACDHAPGALRAAGNALAADATLSLSRFAAKMTPAGTHRHVADITV
jgi:DNA-binding SARP family transcriptional activator